MTHNRSGQSMYGDHCFLPPRNAADRSQDAARDEAFATQRIALNVQPPPPPEKRKHRRRMTFSVDMYVCAVERRHEET